MKKMKNKRQNNKYFFLWIISTVALIVVLAGSLKHDQLKPVQNAVLQPAKVVLNMKGDLAATVIEDCIEDKPVENVRIKIDGKEVALEKPGFFNAKGLSTGEHLVSIEGSAYEKLEKKIIIDKGGNKIAFKLCLAPDEAARRWMQTKKENRHADTYLELHPDEKKRIGLKNYVEFKRTLEAKKSLEIESYTIQEPEFLLNWKHPETGKTYGVVAAMRATGIIKSDELGRVKKSWNIYAQKVGGRWTFLLAE